MYKILVVEDETIIRKGMIYSFEWSKYNCVIIGEAENGKEGLEQIKLLKPDIVIADISMPLMNGIDMIREGNKLCPFASIILTGYDEFNYAKQAIKLEVSDYLLKPLSNEDLGEAIMRAKSKVIVKRNYNNLESEVSNLAEKNLMENIAFNEVSILVQNMIKYIDKNYMNKFRIEDVAMELASSPTTMNEKFKKQTGITYHDYLNRYRITKAIILIKEKQTPIYSIAEHVGFADTKYFNKVFKKYIGVSPTQLLKVI